MGRSQPSCLSSSTLLDTVTKPLLFLDVRLFLMSDERALSRVIAVNTPLVHDTF